MVARRLETPAWLIPAGILGLACVTGFLAGSNPTMAIALGCGVAFLLITLTDLSKGVVAFTLLTFIALLPGFAGPGVNVTKGAGAILAISWLASATAGEGRRQFPNAHPMLALALIGLLVWNGLSALWAVSLPSVEVSTISFALNFALFPIVFAAVRSKKDVRQILAAFIFGAVLAALYGVVTQPNASALSGSATAASGLNRLSGTIKDPNELAAVLAVGIALSTAFVFDKSRAAAVRTAAMGAVAVLMFCILLTLSRGGLIALGAGMAAWIVIASRRRAQALVATALIVLAAVYFFVAVAPPAARDRITKADGGSGRTDIWKVGWRMVKAHPLEGVGAGNFQQNSIHYLLAPGPIKFSQYIVDVPEVAHNAYLQVLAEIGVVGLAFFVFVIAGCLGATARAAQNFRRRDDQQGELLSVAVFVALASILAGYFFLSDEHSKYLWLLLSLGPALLHLSNGGEQDATQPVV
jgi:O-antigen ligase